jgi:transposase
MDTKTTDMRDVREYRRYRAWDLYQSGWRQRDIVAALGVSKGAVSQWLKRATTEGPASLARKTSAGPKPRLTGEQMTELTTLLAQGAEAHGFRGDLWTCGRVATLIEHLYHVRYHPAHVSRLLRAVGWSVQKPVRRASQRDEAAIKEWAEHTWPTLKKRPRTRGAPSSSSTNPAST